MGAKPLQDLLVSLGEDDGGGGCHLVFLERLRAHFEGNEVILDIEVISKDGDGGLEVVFELQGLMVCLGVEGEDEEGAEIVEECPSQHLVRFKYLYL